MLRSVLSLLLLGSSIAADPSVPQEHTGKLDPFQPGPPAPLSASELASIESGKPLQKTVPLPGGTGARASTVFLVDAPPAVVWECINDIRAYPRMVPGVSETSVYGSGTTRSGGQQTLVTYTLAMLGYRICYYLDLQYEPRKDSMTFKLGPAFEEQQSRQRAVR